MASHFLRWLKQSQGNNKKQSWKYSEFVSGALVDPWVWGSQSSMHLSINIGKQQLIIAGKE